MATRKRNNKTAKVLKNADVLTVNLHDKPIVRILPAYNEADSLQRIRACGILAGFVNNQILDILDNTKLQQVE